MKLERLSPIHLSATFTQKKEFSGGEDRCHSNVGRIIDELRSVAPQDLKKYRIAMFWKATRLSSDGLPFVRAREGEEPKGYFDHSILVDDQNRVYDLYAPQDVFGASVEDYIKGVFASDLEKTTTPDEFRIALASAVDVPRVKSDGTILLDFSTFPSTKIVTMRNFCKSKF